MSYKDPAAVALGRKGGKKADLIGRTVNVISGCYEGHWGIIKAFDGERYHVSGGSIGDGCPIFDRDEFTVERAKAARRKAGVVD